MWICIETLLALCQDLAQPDTATLADFNPKFANLTRFDYHTKHFRTSHICIQRVKENKLITS